MRTEYKFKIIKFILYKDLLQRRIYFLTSMESLEMIFSHYKETSEVLLDHQTIGGEDIKYYVKKSIMNLLHANIDFHIIMLIDELAVHWVKFPSKIQSHCANMNFSDKSRYDRISRRFHTKEENQQWVTSKYSKMHRLYQFQWKQLFWRSIYEYFIW